MSGMTMHKGEPDGPRTPRVDYWRDRATAAEGRVKALEEGLRTLDSFFDFGMPPTEELPVDIDPSPELADAFHLAAALLADGASSPSPDASQVPGNSKP